MTLSFCSSFFKIILVISNNSKNLILALLLIYISSISLNVSSNKLPIKLLLLVDSIAFMKKSNFSLKFISFCGILFSCISIKDICILTIASFKIFPLFELASFLNSPILKLYKIYISLFLISSFKFNSRLQSYK